MARLDEKQAKHRRGADPAEEEYLARVGERLRNNRALQGMSRKVLSLASGVSERYLAEMERGAGNASLLVMRRLAAALGIRVSELTAEAPDRSDELRQTIDQLQQLPPAQLADLRRWLASRFEQPQDALVPLSAFIALRANPGR